MRELLEEIDDPESMTRLCRHVSRSVQTYMTTDMNEDTLLGLQQLRDGGEVTSDYAKKVKPAIDEVLTELAAHLPNGNRMVDIANHAVNRFIVPSAVKTKQEAETAMEDKLQKLSSLAAYCLERLELQAQNAIIFEELRSLLSPDDFRNWIHHQKKANNAKASGATREMVIFNEAAREALTPAKSQRLKQTLAAAKGENSAHKEGLVLAGELAKGQNELLSLCREQITRADALGERVEHLIHEKATAAATTIATQEALAEAEESLEVQRMTAIILKGVTTLKWNGVPALCETLRSLHQPVALKDLTTMIAEHLGIDPAGAAKAIVNRLKELVGVTGAVRRQTVTLTPDQVHSCAAGLENEFGLHAARLAEVSALKEEINKSTEVQEALESEIMVANEKRAEAEAEVEEVTENLAASQRQVANVERFAGEDNAALQKAHAENLRLSAELQNARDAAKKKPAAKAEEFVGAEPAAPPKSKAPASKGSRDVMSFLGSGPTKQAQREGKSIGGQGRPKVPTNSTVERNAKGSARKKAGAAPKVISSTKGSKPKGTTTAGLRSATNALGPSKEGNTKSKGNAESKPEAAEPAPAASAGEAVAAAAPETETEFEALAEEFSEATISQ